jgi:hypothetical protein
MAAIGTTARTGEICPESGVWAVVSQPSTTAPIAKGNRMPRTTARPSSGNSSSTRDCWASERTKGGETWPPRAAAASAAGARSPAGL